ncbi:cell adhesion molecule 1-like [Ruditapes philippinarum]|uniref:cell adhesion molecule 1-like n=1 Tax=Ruditapes philippinarum TaxID=129788 RepID=UPI00295B3667|nr:cell adhesion molecule 1-like [Ruditapes philippinarum]
MVNGQNIQYNSAGNNVFNNIQIPIQKRNRLGWASDLKGLVMRNVSVADEGRYVCNGSETSLTVRVRPSRLTIEQISVASAGNRVEVNCTSTVSKPAANLRWVYKNESLLGRQVSVLDNITKTYTVTSILEMQAVADDNGRSVLCIVSHPLLVNQMQSNASVDLKILFPVKPASTKITGNEVANEPGQSSLTLNCTTGSSNPASDIKWFNGSLN